MLDCITNIADNDFNRRVTSLRELKIVIFFPGSPKVSLMHRKDNKIGCWKKVWDVWVYYRCQISNVIRRGGYCCISYNSYLRT